MYHPFLSALDCRNEMSVPQAQKKKEMEDKN